MDEPNHLKSAPQTGPAATVPLRSRLRMLAAAWGITAAVMTIGEPGCWVFFWLFPIFTPFAWINSKILKEDIIGGSHLYLELGLGWLYYLILTVLACRLVGRRAFLWVFYILCFSLLLNIVGCQVLLHSNN
jgi:hypothetical protein